MKLFFFYGSLRKGGYNHHLLNGKAHFIDNIVLPFKLCAIGHKYPAMISESGICYGEVYAIVNSEDKLLDHLEGLSKDTDRSLFVKKIVKYGSLDITTYFAGKSLEEECTDGIEIANGDWIDYLHKKKYNTNSHINKMYNMLHKNNLYNNNLKFI